MCSNSNKSYKSPKPPNQIELCYQSTQKKDSKLSNSPRNDKKKSAEDGGFWCTVLYDEKKVVTMSNKKPKANM